MDNIWNGIGTIVIVIIVCTKSRSLYVIVKERMRRRAARITGEKIPPWYINVIFRKQSEWFVNGVLLIISILVLERFRTYGPSIMLWTSFYLLVYVLFLMLFLFYEEVGRRWTARETGEKWPHRLYRYQFHQRIAFAMCMLGMSVLTLLNGLVAVKVQSLEEVRRIDWLWVSLIVIGILYWLIARGTQEIKMRRTRLS